MPKLPASLRKEPDSLATDARIKMLIDQVGQLRRAVGILADYLTERDQLRYATDGDVPGIARQFMQ
jgi:hypothetical protein